MSRDDLVDRIADTVEQLYDEGEFKIDVLAALIGVTVSEAITGGMSEDEFVMSVRNSFRRTKKYAETLEEKDKPS